MSLIPDFGLAPHEDDEGLFSRDISGQLVRLDAPTENDYDKPVTILVNGQPVDALSEVLRAVRQAALRRPLSHA